jgi:hypothetical protein
MDEQEPCLPEESQQKQTFSRSSRDAGCGNCKIPRRNAVTIEIA